MSKNSGLNEAGKNKKDEFYTQLTDIEKELKHYRSHFKGKTVLCNCDDPFESNFFKYFCLNFNKLGLKKLIATSYSGSSIAGDELDLFQVSGLDYLSEGNKTPYKAVVTTVYDKTGDGELTMDDIAELLKSGENELTVLEGSGDFRSEECIELLKEADIVVTNPPFSKFREYIKLLMDYDKKFIILGNQNAITYKEIFPLFKENKMWLGPSIHSGDRKFHVPDDYPLDASGCGVDADGKKWVRVKGVRWFTNLEYPHRHEDLILVEKYDPKKYPTYLNKDAIEVASTKDIPRDFAGVIGAPISFMDKYNPDQFEIIGCPDYKGKYGADESGVKRIGEKWLSKYRKQGGRGHYTANMINLVFYLPDGTAKKAFKRIFIRNKHPEAAQ